MAVTHPLANLQNTANQGAESREVALPPPRKCYPKGAAIEIAIYIV